MFFKLGFCTIRFEIHKNSARDKAIVQPKTHGRFFPLYSADSRWKYVNFLTQHPQHNTPPQWQLFLSFSDGWKRRERASKPNQWRNKSISLSFQSYARRDFPPKKQAKNEPISRKAKPPGRRRTQRKWITRQQSAACFTLPLSLTHFLHGTITFGARFSGLK